MAKSFLAAYNEKKELYRKYGFTSVSETCFSRKLISPENSESTCEITIIEDSEGFSVSVKEFFDGCYDGSTYTVYKSLKRGLTSMEKNLAWYGFAAVC